MNEPISATEAARRFSDLLNRVRYRGESFTIVRNGEAVASLTGAASRPSVNLRSLMARLQELWTDDREFADDLERIVAEQPAIGDSPWDS